MNNVTSETIAGSGSDVSFNGVLGRYVRIKQNVVGMLNLSEVEVSGAEDPTNLVNLALSPSAPAMQLSTCSNGSDSAGVTSRAIDGESDGSFGKYTFTCYDETEYQ